MKKLLLAIILLMSLTALFAGNSHPVFVELLYNGVHPDAATWQAWIVGREGEVLTETSGGCAYYGAGSGAYQGTISVQVGTFPTNWAIGDIVHVVATSADGEAIDTTNPNSYVEYALDGAGAQYYGDLYAQYSEGPGIVITTGNTPIDIPTGEEYGANDSVTPDVNVGTYVDGGYGESWVQGQGYDTSLPCDNPSFQPENIGISIEITIDDATFPTAVTVTLEGISYIPYDLAYLYNGSWHYVGNDQFTSTALPDPQITFTMSGAKGAKGDVTLPIVFANTPNNDHNLPVELLRPLVTQQAQFAQISWATASESNMNGYQLWRSTTESREDAITVSGLISAQNQTVEHTYSFTDRNVAVGNTYYYWLEAANYDGNSHFYDFGSIEINADQAPVLPQVTELSANYPNPFNPETKISFKVKEGETATLAIYNQKGQVVSRNSYVAGNHEIVWDGTKQASGIYFYKLQSPTYSKIRKMIMLK